jgi:hypothetical protein
MVKNLASFLAVEVQRPITEALEKSKTVRHEVKERRQARADYEGVRDRQGKPGGNMSQHELQDKRERFQSSDMYARRGVDEVRSLCHPFVSFSLPCSDLTFGVGKIRAYSTMLITNTLVLQLQESSLELTGRVVGAFVSCQKMMAQEMQKLNMEGDSGRSIAALSRTFPRGLVAKTASKSRPVQRTPAAEPAQPRRSPQKEKPQVTKTNNGEARPRNGNRSGDLFDVGVIHEFVASNSGSLMLLCVCCRGKMVMRQRRLQLQLQLQRQHEHQRQHQQRPPLLLADSTIFLGQVVPLLALQPVELDRAR